MNTVSGSLSSLTSYVDSRLNNANTQQVGGRTINTETGQIVTGADSLSDSVKLSNEARAALARIDAMSSRLNMIQEELGGRNLTEAEVAQVLEVTAKLDDIYDVETAPPSEAFLYLTDANRAEATEVLSKIVGLYEGLEEGESLSEDDKLTYDALVAELDTLLDDSRVRSSHNIADLGEEQQEQVLALFVEMANLLGAEGGMSEAETEAAADISNSIDAIFAEYGEEKGVRELSAAEKSEAESLLKELADLFEAAGSASLKSFLIESKAQTTSIFLKMLNGEEGGRGNSMGDFLQSLQGGSGDAEDNMFASLI